MNVNRKPIVAAVVIRNHDTLLIQRRVKEGSLLWAFCSGEIEDGETPSMAAVREAREELGISIEGLGEIGRRVHPSTGRDMVYVSSRLLPGSAKPTVVDTDELADVTWASLADVQRLIGDSIFEPVWKHLQEQLG